MCISLFLFHIQYNFIQPTYVLTDRLINILYIVAPPVQGIKNSIGYICVYAPQGCLVNLKVVDINPTLSGEETQGDHPKDWFSLGGNINTFLMPYHSPGACAR